METAATPAATLFGLPMSIVGLLIAIFVLIYLVLRTRVHAFIAMLIAASIAGIFGRSVASVSSSASA